MGRPPNLIEKKKVIMMITLEDYNWLKTNSQYDPGGILHWAIEYHKKIGAKIKEVDKNY